MVSQQYDLLQIGMLSSQRRWLALCLPAGSCEVLDADVGILPRLLGSSPLRMLCLQHTGTMPSCCPRVHHARLLQCSKEATCDCRPAPEKTRSCVVCLPHMQTLSEHSLPILQA